MNNQFFEGCYQIEAEDFESLNDALVPQTQMRNILLHFSE